MAQLSQVRSRISGELCGQCHRRPETANSDPKVIEAQLSRFQGLALSRSECFKQSGGRLSCITCHNPHRNADKLTRADYNQRCVSCHTPGAAGETTCKITTTGDCVSCHMPLQAAEMPTRPKFRTHWIRPHKKDLVQAFEMQRKAPHAP